MLRRAQRAVGVMTVALATALAPHVCAQDLSVARHDVVSADDFRLRMSAALALGRSRDPGARMPLERAISDPHPGVRTAAAAALAALGDPAALPALSQRLAREPGTGVKAQIASAVASLTRLSTFQGVQFVVEIGSMRNATAVRGDALVQVLKSSTATRARSMTNALVAYPGDAALLARAAEKHVPVVALDGALLTLTQQQSGGATQLSARVEFSMRRVPEQALKGVLTGNATSVGQGRVAPDERGLAQLQDQAVDGAVASALRGASAGMLLAVK